MANPRTPLLKAQATGRILHDPKRFQNRKEPVVKEPLGPPPKWLKGNAKTAWQTFAKELPWLNRSHRALVEIASHMRGQLMASNEVPIAAMTLLRQCLGQLGATPADASKIRMLEDDAPDDPSGKYF